MASGFAGLVPEQYDDFRSLSFWDTFFETRRQKAFEWYGEWPQLRPIVQQLCAGRSVLVPGCGNSDLSAGMYDAGITRITNIDFSKVCIKEMLTKNLRARPLMKWQVMDVTDMKFSDGNFEVVMDKGTLDALMGDDNPAARSTGVKFLEEVSRVLSESGVYICVTLAQPHVLGTLLSHFCRDWAVAVHKLPPPADMASCALQPYLVVSERCKGAAATGPPLAVQQLFKVTHNVVDAQHLAAVAQVIAEHNERRSHMLGADSGEGQDFDVFHPGRRVVLQLGKGGGAAGFKAVVMDLKEQRPPGMECAVFLVPQGQEHLWLFSSAEGQWEVASSCGSQRVILVAIQRSTQQFSDMAEVQRALSPLVLPLIPLVVRHLPKSVPYVSSDDGIGQRRIVEQVTSEISGDIVVEDVELTCTSPATTSGRGAPPRSTHWVRRMVFVSSCNLVQSEAELVIEAAAAGGKKKGVKAGPRVVDPSRLSCHYQAAIVLACGLLQQPAAADGGSGRLKALVIGLGGGCLPVYLNKYLNMQVDVVELDAAVVGLAQRHFNITPALQEAGLTITVADGLASVEQRAKLVEAGDEQAPYHLVVVDADAGDASLALSCPPAAFVEPSFLAAAKQLLHPGGLLAINCVSRAKAPYTAALTTVKAVFESVLELDIDGDVNRVIAAQKAGSAGGSGEAGVKVQRESLVSGLRNIAPSDSVEYLSSILANMELTAS